MSGFSSFKSSINEIPNNLFSGFVVSLVALPLALGLAIASEAPPISGLIAAIVGGVVCSFLGGSQLTITGPGNGLVIVLLASITSLGDGDLYQGYLYTLAAIILSGILLFLFGVFRLGALSEFFPSSALQGMLAAIGIGILAKQLHVMLGVSSINGSPLELLAKVPWSIKLLFSSPSFSVVLSAGLGVVSLFILIFYSRLRSPFFQFIPAPMWVVIVAIGLSYYFELFLGFTAPFEKSLLISFPENLWSNFPSPDFSIAYSMPFIASVLSITLIASIESLLSIKAVDKLDPKKRRSNVNKDLRALGLATALSGMIGGLNVVTVIARSSVNVNNGGTNRSSNIAHALFLLAFLLLFQDQIQRIALPALAAILVYTGYKLAAPANFLRILKIGKEQLVIFGITVLITLTNGLIMGISCGVLATFLIHAIINKNLFLFTRNFLKPNVLMYLEEESGNYYVSVKNFCSFLNFYKLKKKLDEIPESEHAIIDFSMCEFVDHTVMEGLNEYRRSFARKGGVFELIGLDSHSAETQHPFAIRKSMPDLDFFNLTNNLTKRQLSLQKLAKILNWNYASDLSTDIKDLERFDYFKTKIINYRYNELISKEENFRFFDLSYSEGAFIAKDDVFVSFLLIDLSYSIPQFILDRETFLSNINAKSTYKDINFSKFPDFSRRFFLGGKDSGSIRSLFDSELIFFFESHAYFRVESIGKGLLIKNKSRLSSVQEIKSLFAFATELMSLLNKKYL
ncbi:MAG: sulfate transporter [Flavobacteriaceae bacterium]|nr:sulfate transporter [Flavobacteriaceae bacterium]|tara:strand:- start:44769 stop:46988 length:2220 start_codon:yes stop_codon:yes gene_type:complete